MNAFSILLVGVLVVVGMLVITSAIASIAPYIAGTLIILGLGWITLRSKRE